MDAEKKTDPKAWVFFDPRHNEIRISCQFKIDNFTFRETMALEMWKETLKSFGEKVKADEFDVKLFKMKDGRVEKETSIQKDN